MSSALRRVLIPTSPHSQFETWMLRLVGGSSFGLTAPRAIAASIVLLLVASCGPSTPPSNALSSSSPVAKASTSVSSPIPIPTLSKTFTSPMMGYSVKHPGGWAITRATERWVPGRTSYWDTPDGDRLEGDSAGFRGTSQALASGQSASQWIAEYITTSRPCGNQEQVSVGGQVGMIDLNDCAGFGRLGGRVFDLVVVAGGRGYNFTMEGRVDRNFFLAVLGTVTFSPQSATP